MTTRKSSRLLPSDSAASRWGHFQCDGPDRFEDRVPCADCVATICMWVGCIGARHFICGRVLGCAQASRGGFCRRVAPFHDDVCCNSQAQSDRCAYCIAPTPVWVGCLVLMCGFLTTRKSSRLSPSGSAASRGFFYCDGPDRFEGRVFCANRVASIRMWLGCIGTRHFICGRVLGCARASRGGFCRRVVPLDDDVLLQRPSSV